MTPTTFQNTSAISSGPNNSLSYESKRTSGADPSPEGKNLSRSEMKVASPVKEAMLYTQGRQKTQPPFSILHWPLTSYYYLCKVSSIVFSPLSPSLSPSPSLPPPLSFLFPSLSPFVYVFTLYPAQCLPPLSEWGPLGILPPWHLKSLLG